MKRIQIYSSLIAILSVLTVVTGQVGYRFWALDLVNHFLPYFIFTFVIFTAIAISFFKRRLAAIFLIVSLIVLCWFQFQSPWNQTSMASKDQETLNLRLISYNLLTGNLQKKEAVKWILSNLRSDKANLVFLAEVDAEWDRELQPLRERLKHYREATRDDNFGIAIYSDRPFVKMDVKSFDFSKVPAAAAVIKVGKVASAKVQFIGIHPLPPVNELSFDSRNEFYRNLKVFQSEASLPTIIAGDFNSTPWSPHFSENFGSMIRAYQGPFQPHTWRQGLLSIPIDHVLYSSELRQQSAFIGPHNGSDHRPIVVDF